MRRPTSLDRRSVLVTAGTVATGGVVAALTGCSDSSRPSAPAHRSPVGARASSSAPDADARLRASAVADERRLLAACAAPAGQEPFATLRRLHADHLRVLTGQPAVAPAPAAHPPVAGQLLGAEHAAAAARRADCVRATPSLAPILASLAASSDVAGVLLAP